MVEFMAPAFTPLIEEHRVCSMAGRPDCAYLWDRYASGSTGCCFEFHNDQPIVGGASLTRRVSYGERFVLDISDIDNISGAFIFHKTRDYAKEEEIRIMLVPRGAGERQRFDPSRLNRVIIGRDMAAGNRRLIEKWCRKRKPGTRNRRAGVT
jgi:hypothetical protein